MRASSFAILAAAAVVGQASANTPPGVFPVDNNQMTNFYDTSVLATNGVNIPKANTAIAPTVAFDTQLNGTFAIVMFDPDTPATGIGGNGTNSFLHWFQDGLTSVSTPVNVAGRGVFPLANAANIGPVQGYLAPGPPAGETHRYVQILMDTTGVTGFTVSAQIGNATLSRVGFDMNRFVTEAKLKVVGSNFFNVTGV